MAKIWGLSNAIAETMMFHRHVNVLRAVFDD